MSNSPTPPQSNTAVPITGASVLPQYARRVMKVYAINENEVVTISSLNAQATIFYSLASFLASFAVGIYTNAMFATDTTVAGKLAQFYIAPTLLVISLAFVAAAFMNGRKRNKLWDGIKEESET